jgi:hypothetical protein
MGLLTGGVLTLSTHCNSHHRSFVVLMPKQRKYEATATAADVGDNAKFCSCDRCVAIPPYGKPKAVSLSTWKAHRVKQQQRDNDKRTQQNQAHHHTQEQQDENVNVEEIADLSMRDVHDEAEEEFGQ